MAKSISSDLLDRARKLARLAADLRQGQAFEVTRLTILKKMCQDHRTANSFVTHLARKTIERVERGKGRSGHPDTPQGRSRRQMMAEALAEMDSWLRRPSDAQRRRMRELCLRIHDEQNEYESIPFGAVRLVRDWDLLLIEKALDCLLGTPNEAPYWAYQMARAYAERTEAGTPYGLVSGSAPLVEDMVHFWADYLGVDRGALTTPAKGKKMTTRKRPSGGRATASRPKAKFTARQGQFLAFLNLYRKFHRCGPSEVEIARYFDVTPPAAHLMLVKLEDLGLITREPGVPRSARLVIPEEEVPELEWLEGRPW